MPGATISAQPWGGLWFAHNLSTSRLLGHCPFLQTYCFGGLFSYIPLGNQPFLYYTLLNHQIIRRYQYHNCQQISLNFLITGVTITHLYHICEYHRSQQISFQFHLTVFKSLNITALTTCECFQSAKYHKFSEPNITILSCKYHRYRMMVVVGVSQP